MTIHEYTEQTKTGDFDYNYLIKMISKTQIDRLGERLRKEPISEADLRTLDEYRQSFASAYEFVVQTLIKELSLNPTGRPAKSTPAIREKLHRESIRLSQIQDIAGCRLVVDDIVEQEKLIPSLSRSFANANLVDRRKNPSHGYRAVHLIVMYSDRPVEIQVRTSLQHLWAELSEKLSDVLDPAIKYGGDVIGFRDILSRSSRMVADEEALELRIAFAEQAGERSVKLGPETISIAEWHVRQTKVKHDVLDFFEWAISEVIKRSS